MQIGLIGCGTVGTTIGGRLLAAGHELRVHDLSRENAGALIDAGASWCATPRDVASDVDALVGALPGPPAVEQAILGETGAWSAMQPRTLYIETSTVGVATTERLAREAAPRKIRFLDAPLSRGRVNGDVFECGNYCSTDASTGSSTCSPVTDWVISQAGHASK